MSTPENANAAAENTPVADAPVDPLAKKFEIGQHVEFSDYFEAPKDFVPDFEKGDVLRLEAAGKDTSEENYEAVRLTDGKKGTVYHNEIVVYVAPEPATKKGKAKKEKAEKAPKPPKAEKVKPEPAPEPPLILTEAVRSLVGTDAEAIASAKRLSSDIDTSEFVLGGVLASVKRNKSYLSIKDAEGKQVYTDDQKGWENFLNEEMTCGYRKGQYLISLYTKYTPLGINESQVAKIGWSKAVAMLNVISDANKVELLEYAETHTKDEVIEHVKTLKVATGDNTSSRGIKTAFKFALFNDNAQSVESIFAEARKDLPADASESDVFLKITTEWSQWKAGFNTEATSETETETQPELIQSEAEAVTA